MKAPSEEGLSPYLRRVLHRCDDELAVAQYAVERDELAITGSDTALTTVPAVPVCVQTPTSLDVVVRVAEFHAYIKPLSQHCHTGPYVHALPEVPKIDSFQERFLGKNRSCHLDSEHGGFGYVNLRHDNPTPREGPVSRGPVPY